MSDRMLQGIPQIKQQLELMQSQITTTLEKLAKEDDITFYFHNHYLNMKRNFRLAFEIMDEEIERHKAYD
jgi:ABC-type oligopeptide transport system ATPase subunit